MTISDRTSSLMGALHDPILGLRCTPSEKDEKPNQFPQDIGAVNSSSSKEKDFYTSAEIDKLTSKELDDPKIFDRVMKSLAKLGR